MRRGACRSGLEVAKKIAEKNSVNTVAQKPAPEGGDVFAATGKRQVSAEAMIENDFFGSAGR
jgi:hypothetical protein